METERPACHGWGACVHRTGGRLDLMFREDPVGGIDWERHWQWHCPEEPCDNYSLVLIVLEEWFTDGT